MLKVLKGKGMLKHGLYRDLFAHVVTRSTAILIPCLTYLGIMSFPITIDITKSRTYFAASRLKKE